MLLRFSIKKIPFDNVFKMKMGICVMSIVADSISQHPPVKKCI